MKLLLTILLLFSTIASADDWSQEDTERETIFATLMVLDWRQTMDIARHSDIEETNPVLGKHPNNARINTYFAASLAAQYLIAQALPAEYRRCWQNAGIVFEATVVGGNYRLGLQIGW